MSWILQIDTALEVAIVSLSEDGRLVGEKINLSLKDHAAFLHPGVKCLMEDAGITLSELSAVAVVVGPGSYTGLRVGIAAAKGFCFALSIPLITIGTLHLMAASALTQLKENHNYGTMLVCPMIDARRMEVYCALYNYDMEVFMASNAVILQSDTFANLLLKNMICFFGTGSEKWRTQCTSENAFFIKEIRNPLILSELAYDGYRQKNFANIAYLEPLYLKDFYMGGVN